MSAIPRVVVEAVLGRSGGNCEAMVKGARCTMRAEHLHHRQLRSQGGGHTVENLVYVCHRCHDWVHKHPSQAMKLGLIVSGRADPGRVKVNRRGRWVILTGSGECERQAGAAREGDPFSELIDWGETTKWQ